MDTYNFFYERPVGSRQMYENINREPTPYEILGIPYNSDKTTIKNAYRTLAKQWHPDKNKEPQAAQKFKEINNAYESLTKCNPNEINFEELFEEGIDTIIGNLFSGMMNMKENDTSSSILQDVNVTLEELYTGTTKIIQYTRNKIDKTVENTMCDRCKGSGVVSIIEKLNAIMLSQKMDKCPQCNGKGFSGTILQNILEEVTVTIPPGTALDEKIIIKEQGNESLNGLKGDLIIQTVSHNHEYYSRLGDDLSIEIDVSFKEAMLGFERIIPKLDGTNLKLKFKGPIQFGKRKIIKGKGMPLLHKKEKGNLIINFKFNLPKKLSEEQKTIIEQNF